MASVTVGADRAGLERLRDDPVAFSEALIGEPLWKHQREVARSEARIRVICSGRQAGKSRTLAVLAVHEAFRLPGRRVLILSATEDGAKDLLAEIAGLASAHALAASVVDENKSELTLTNGSRIRSIPTSQRRARGPAVDLLILDEAAFIEDEIWNAARFTVIARPGSRVVMASTPWGRADRFFAVSFRAGLRRGRVDGYESFHWPSTVSPLVDRELLKMWRETSTDREYRAEVLAEWVDDSGSYFSASELENAVSDREPLEPGRGRGLELDAGVDWAFSRDASTCVAVAQIRARSAEQVRQLELAARFGIGSAEVQLARMRDADEQARLWVPIALERFNTGYRQFIDEVVSGGSRPGGYRFVKVCSEQNGVGAMPTQELEAAFRAAGVGAYVQGVHTTARSKEDAFGFIKLLLQQGRLEIPRPFTNLLRQLSNLEFEVADSGSMRIAVPERAGHDDLAMGLALAVTPWVESGGRRGQRAEGRWVNDSLRGTR